MRGIPSRWRLLGFCVPIALALTTSICPNGEPTVSPAFMFVLVDRSGSSHEDLSVYRAASERVIALTGAGDRFILAPITSSSARDFRLDIDVTFPAAHTTSFWANPMSDQREANEAEKKIGETRVTLLAQVGQFLDQPMSTSHTTIFQALGNAAQTMAGDDQRKILIILSDMIEDSGTANFDRTPPNASYTQKEIERQRNIGTLPDLAAVRIYVAGAHASTPEAMSAIHNFWDAYFTAAGGELVRYERVLSSFSR